jgi:hypothetical protein
MIANISIPQALGQIAEKRDLLTTGAQLASNPILLFELLCGA